MAWSSAARAVEAATAPEASDTYIEITVSARKEFLCRCTYEAGEFGVGGVYRLSAQESGEVEAAVFRLSKWSYYW
jgi:hypothetical protein